MDQLANNKNLTTLDERSLVVETGRQQGGMALPIMLTVGWLVMAYFMVYYFVAFISPALFGTRRPISGPFYADRGPWPFARRARRGVLATMGDLVDLTAKVARALEGGDE